MRLPNLIEAGVLGRSTDLGEPERFFGGSCYAGFAPGRNRHPELHNMYNFLWHESVHEGYVRNGTAQRPFVLTRAARPLRRSVPR